MHPITDDQAKAILADLKEPRITIEYMESRIVQEEYINPDLSPTTTICILKLDNGFISIGTSTPAAAGNFNMDLGKKYAREHAIRELWGKFGFALTEKIHAAKAGVNAPLAGVEVPATPSGDKPSATTTTAPSGEKGVSLTK